MEQKRLVIIGSGPAGYGAAIYAARAGLEPVVLGGESAGGQLMLTTEVENYAGFSKGVMGPVLMQEMREQAVRFGAVMVDTYATAVDFSSRPFKVWTQTVSDKSQEEPAYAADAVILATGAKAKMLEVPGEAEYIGRGVSYCAVCDAAFFRNKRVVLIGGGDAAMEDALALVKFASGVQLVVRGERLRASQLMQDRVLAQEKIKVRWQTVVEEVSGDGRKVVGVVLREIATQLVSKEEVDGVFVAIGHEPATGFLQNEVALTRQGYVVTRLGLDQLSVALAQTHLTADGLVAFPTMTSVEGVFAAGDNVDFRYRQAGTAAGMGTMAALDAGWWLERN